MSQQLSKKKMKVYSGNEGDPKALGELSAKGYGVLLCNKYRDTAKLPYYAIDNGAYSAWVNGQEWSPEPFLRLMEKCWSSGKLPDFVVVPDIVAGGVSSLKRSLDWIPDLRAIGGTAFYLAVQDGMTPDDIRPVLPLFDGLFIGGTMEWKLSTGADWVQLAHENGKPCHIGRVGTWPRIMWAQNIGADSIDSSSWAQNDSYHHLDYARAQTVIT
jgi:hypothetical protein